MYAKKFVVLSQTNSQLYQKMSRNRGHNQERILIRSVYVLLLAGTLLLTGCLGPVALHEAVLGYDDIVQRLETEMLILNIARLYNNLPDHFTVTSAIAATFDFRASVGFQGAWPGFFNDGVTKDQYSLNVGASVSENPTMSIVPVQGEEFTKRILSPLKGETLGFLAFQGARFDILARVMSRGFEYRTHGKAFQRFVLNDPRVPEEYREFRRIVLHLEWLGQNRQLFVKPITFEQAVRAKLAAPPSASDIANAVEKGYRWRQLTAENEFEFTRQVSGSVAVTNYDPDLMTRAEREALYEFATGKPGNYLMVDIRPGYPGGDFPLFGGFKLRSLDGILAFFARTISEAPEFDVEPDPRTGPIEPNPRRTMAIQVTASAPKSVLRAKFAGKYYSVPNTDWDRSAFFILYKLYQVTVTDVSAVGLPVTIAK